MDRTLDGFETTALVNLLMLRPDETLESERVVDEVGSSMMVNLHYMYDLFRETGTEPPSYVEPIWEEYVAFRTKRDAERDVTEAHRATTATSTPKKPGSSPRRRFGSSACRPAWRHHRAAHDLEQQGLDGINFIAPADRQYEMCDEFADQVIARY